ncbi:MAG: hypothetical protein FWC90_00795, partial [Oscillospiraceae bacterium]|nr:hypothetical protein [Oscillospiraceae bacterium]
MMDVLRLFAARRGFIVEQTALLEGAPADRLIIVAPQGARIDGAVTRNAAANTVTVPGLRNTVPGSVPNPFDAASTLAVGTFGAANINFLDGADPAIGDHVLYFTDALGVTHVRVAESVAGSISYMSGPVANRLVRFGASADTQAEYFGSQMGIEPSIPNPWRFIPFTAQGASIGVQTTAWLDAGGHIFAFDSVRIDPPGYIAVTRVTDIAGAAVITGILSDGRTVVSLQVAGLTAAVIQNQINAGNPIFSYSNLVLLDGGARGTVTLAQIGQANRSRVVPLHTTLGQDGQRFDNRPIGTATILPANDPTQQEFFRTPNFMRIPPVGVVGTAANQVPFADSFTSFVVNGATGIAGLPRDTSTNIGIVTRTQGYANAPFFNNYTTGMRAWAVVYNPPHAGGEETVFVYVDGGNARGAVVAAQRRMFIGLDLQSATLNAGVGPVFEANGNVSVTVVDLDAENNTSRVTLTAAAWAQLQGLIAPNTVVPAKLLNVTVGAGGLIVAVSLPTDTAFGFGFAGITPGNTLTLNPGWWTGNPATPPQAQTFGVSGQVPFIYIALNGTVTVQMGQATPTAMYMWYGVTTGVAPQQNITRFYQVERVNIPVPSLAPATAVLTLPEATALAPANTAVWNALTATPAPAGTVEVPFRFVNQAGATLTAATPATTVVLTADTLGAVTFAWPATAMNPALTVPPATPGTWVVPVSYYGVNLGTVTVTVTPTALPLVIVNPDAVMVGSSADPMTSLSEVQDRLAGLFLLYDGSAVNVPAGTPVNYTNMTWADIITMAPLAMNATRTAGVGTVITSNGAPAVAQAILDVLAELDAGAFGSTSTFVITLDPTDGNPATVTFVLYNQNGLALVDNTAAADAEFAAVQAQLAAIPGVAALVNYNVINTALTELATVFANVDPTNAATVPNPVAVNNLLIAIEALVTGPTDFTALTPAQLALADAVTALVPGSGFTQAQLQAFATAADATSPANAAALMTAFANLAGALPASL